MALVLLKRLPAKAVMSVAALLLAAVVSAHGQYLPPGAYSPAVPMMPPPGYGYGMMCPRPSGMYPPYGMQYAPVPVMPFQPYFPPPHACLPGAAPPAEQQPAQPGQQTPPSTTPPTTPPSDSSRAPDDFRTDMFDSAQNQGEPSLPAGGQGAAGGGDSLALAAPGGYLDNPIPISTFRLRFDAAFDDNRPDRAEYLYAAWKELSFHPHGIQGGGAFFDRGAIGPNMLPAYVNYQQPEAYFEFAFLKRFSAFVQAPYRIIQLHNIQEDFPDNPKVNPADRPNPGSKFFTEPFQENQASPQTNFNGFSDMQFGFKGAILASPKQYLTFQLRLYAPSGDPGLGLGTGHWSVEPSLLLYERLTKRLVLQGQLTEWSPIDGGLAGNILQYGAGLGYAVFQRGNFVIMPTTEFMGWTMLNGYQSVFAPISATRPAPNFELPTTHGVEQAGGDTIVNGKFGVRTFFGDGSSLFVGYGRALTGTHWYTDDFRVEYRVFFGRNKNLFRPL